MYKKILTILLLFVVCCLIKVNPNFSAENTATTTPISAINSKFQQYHTIKSKFKQIDNNGNVSYGWFIFAKDQNRARIEYDNNPIRIIINNSSVMLEQIDLHEKSFTPLNTSPFKYIVTKNASLFSPELSLSDPIINNNKYFVSISPKNNSSMGSIVFEFNQKNLMLVGWSIVGDNGEKTTIELINPEFSNKAVANNIFNTHRVINIVFGKL